MKLEYKTVWISDTHLGSKGARAKELSRFLKQVRCEKLYLVGAINEKAAADKVAAA